jgi:HPt (histidine-containing phosphotransfer) domain-containing protein
MANSRCGLKEHTPDAKGSEETLDPAGILARVGGNRGLLRELVKLFLEDCPAWMTEIRATIDHRDVPRLTYCTHQLRGSVGNFGGSVAYERARQLEALARAGDLTAAANVYSLLEADIQQFQQTLTQLVQEPATAMPDSPHSPPHPTLSPLPGGEGRVRGPAE